MVQSNLGLRASVSALLLLAGCTESDVGERDEPQPAVKTSVATSGPKSIDVILGAVEEASADVVQTNALNDYDHIQMNEGAEFDVFIRSGKGIDEDDSRLIEFNSGSRNSGKLQRYDQTFGK